MLVDFSDLLIGDRHHRSEAFAWAMCFGSTTSIMSLVVVPGLLNLKFRILHRGKDETIQALHESAAREEREPSLRENA